ncbi:MAG: hypothetical protein C6W56_03070 [Caldibacillus debilis]|nr:MAG: hypothetical protein C6W56_03070 [Caldibacillus debilis]
MSLCALHPVNDDGQKMTLWRFYAFVVRIIGRAWTRQKMPLWRFYPSALNDRRHERLLWRATVSVRRWIAAGKGSRSKRRETSYRRQRRNDSHPHGNIPRQ